MGRDKQCMHPSLRAPSHVTKISVAENGLKVVNFEVVYLGK